MHFTAKLCAAVLVSGGLVSANCGAAATEIAGNFYCSNVKQLQYSNVGTSGTYQQVTYMGADGTCNKTPKSFSGPLAPLNEEVSLHFRGPMVLKQFAAYSITSKKREVSKTHVRRHNHAAHHARKPEAIVSPAENALEQRNGNDDWVVATINGKVVSWHNNYFGPGVAAPTPAPAVIASVVPVVPVPVATTSAAKACITSFGAAPPKATPSTSPAPVTGNAAFTRTGYYDAESQTLDGLTFLGNYGGQESGVWDTKFGNSLSYLNSAGTGSAASAQILSDTTIGSNQEFAIMTDKPCDTDGSCGYVRPGAVAYHGFSGADKIFVFEFSMPLDGSAGFNADMPAIWMLNAEVPRTVQYGSCSCWETGCGEFDIVEVLSSGSVFCKSTLHTNTPAGIADYIARPTASTMKLAVVFSSATSEITVQVLADDTVFGASLTDEQVDAMMASTPSALKSLFQVVAS